MKIKSQEREYTEYKTARQWALNGYLPIEGAAGVELWANQFCQDKFVYYSPEEVAEATAEQTAAFFAPERERRNFKARRRRQRQREKIEKARAEVEQMQLQAAIDNAITPYINRITELQDIIKAISADTAPKCGTDTLIIDTETTGLDPCENELLQVSIIDSKGNVLFDSYFRPAADSWTEAERVNHITPDKVKNAPRISEKIAGINAIMSRAHTLIGYNLINFDIPFLKNNGLILPKDLNIVDVMLDFAEVYGEYSEYFNNYKWQKLTTAADFYNYDWSSRAEGAHNSLADCFATLYVYKAMQNHEEGRGE